MRHGDSVAQTTVKQQQRRAGDARQIRRAGGGIIVARQQAVMRMSIVEILAQARALTPDQEKQLQKIAARTRRVYLRATPPQRRGSSTSPRCLSACCAISPV